MESLPVERTTFVGRVRETTLLTALLLREDVRIVTLTGPGGIGKTRLSLKVADALSAHFEHGVRFVPLESISDPRLVTRTVADTLRVVPPPGTEVETFLASTLATSEMLLVLDNFEQVLPAAPAISTLLSQCPGLKVLATSRAPLDITGEHTFAVPPLALVEDEAAAMAKIGSTEAIQLFVDRATSVDQHFALSEANAPVIAMLCRHMDGLPLAIELAASQIRVLPPQTLLERIDANRPLPLPGRRDTPKRHQSLRATISWSYDLLTPREQQVFRLLSVFIGGFGLDAAEAMYSDIASGKDGDQEPEADILPALSSLIANSLVYQEEARATARYSMLVSIRAFGLEQLDACGETGRVRQAHAHWCLGLAERLRWGWMIDNERLSRLHIEHPNMRAALDYLLESGDGERALRLATALAGFWYVHTHFETGAAMLTAAMDLAPDPGNVYWGRASVAKGMLVATQGKWDEANALLADGMETLVGTDDVATMCLVWLWHGAIANYRQKHEEALPQLEKALGLARRVPDPGISAALTARTLSNLGVTARGLNQPDRAIEWHERSMEINREHGFTLGMIRALYDRGETSSDQGDHTAALGYFQECLSLLGNDGDRRVIVDVLKRSAYIAAAWHQPKSSLRLLGAADALRSQYGGFAPTEPDMRVRERTLDLVHAHLSRREAKRYLAEGRTLSPDAAISLVHGLSRQDDSAGADYLDRQQLSSRELDVLRMLVDGASNREIADAIFVSVRTVEAHVKSIRLKLGARSRTDAVVRAIASGLAHPNSSGTTPMKTT